MKEVPTVFNVLEKCKFVSETGVQPWRVYFEDTPLSIFLTHLAAEEHGNFRKATKSGALCTPVF